MSITEMVDSMKKAGLVLSGAVAGVLLSVGLTAYADKQQGVGALPIEDIQKFSQVMALIKDNYVDEVSDKKLIENVLESAEMICEKAHFTVPGSKPWQNDGRQN